MARNKKPDPVQRAVRRFIRDLAGHPRPEPKITPYAKQSEASYRDHLAKKLRGETEVRTPVGNIDVLTDTELIELKNVKNWKAAIGQVKSYGKFYPDHQLRVHLFGAITKTQLQQVHSICSAENIILTWES